MGSTTKTSNWLAYFVLVAALILIASCGVSAEPIVSVEGGELTVSGSALVEAGKDLTAAAKTKAAEMKAYAESDEGKAKAAARKEKTKEVMDTTGKAIKGFTNWTADKVGDAAHFVEKKTR
jgi:cytochrome c5